MVKLTQGEVAILRTRCLRKTQANAIGEIHPNNYHTKYADVICNRPIVVVSISNFTGHPGWYYIKFYPVTEMPGIMGWVNKDRPVTITSRPKRIEIWAETISTG